MILPDRQLEINIWWLVAQVRAIDYAHGQMVMAAFAEKRAKQNRN